MDPTSEKLYFYEFKTALFENGDLGEFLLLVRNSNTTLTASGILDMDAKVQYLRMLVRGETLRRFDSLSANTEGTNP